MDWKNLQTMKCPSCSGKLEDVGMGYQCKGVQQDENGNPFGCEFFVGYEKFQKLINNILMPKKPKYDPDKIDRSNWEW